MQDESNCNDIVEFQRNNCTNSTGLGGGVSAGLLFITVVTWIRIVYKVPLPPDSRAKYNSKQLDC